MEPSLSEPITFTHDELGYRNGPGAGPADVVLIGDSYVEGAYVTDEQTLARQLERALNGPVAKLGVAGYGPAMELVVLQRDAPRYRPRFAVLFFFEGNDLYDDQTFEDARLAPEEAEAESHPHGFARRDGWRQRSFAMAAIIRLRRWANPVIRSQPPYSGLLQARGENGEKVYFHDYASLEWSPWLETRWERARRSFTDVAEFGREHGIEVLFCFVPLKYRVYRPFLETSEDSPLRSWTVWPIRRRFSELCAAEDAACLDLRDPLIEAASEGVLPYSAVDSHWSPEGHALVAELLAEKLRAAGLQTAP